MDLLLSQTHGGIWHYADACRPDPDCSACADAGCPECTPERYCEHGVDLETGSCACATMTADEVAEFDDDDATDDSFREPDPMDADVDDGPMTTGDLMDRLGGREGY